MLTYPNEDEVGLLDLEASTRNILNKSSWIIFEIWPVEHFIDGDDRLQLVAELHIKIRFQKTAVLTRKQQPNDVLNA